MPDEPNIHTEGGAAVSGNVNTGGGDFVGRDHIEGDKITVGDVNNSMAVAVGQNATATVTINQTLPADEIRDRSDLRNLRLLVRRWVDDSLQDRSWNGQLVALQMAEAPEQVDSKAYQFDRPAPQPLAIPQPPMAIFEHNNKRMLILGAPGGGKTTLLLQLTRELLDQAEASRWSPLPAPTPVYANLSTWAQRRLPLAEWLAEDLQIRFQMDRRLTRRWISNQQLLLLLDGLDEVNVEHRRACVEAINQFIPHAPGIVVCCRTKDYAALAEDERLVMKGGGAIELHPLTDEQIDQYTTSAEVRAILRQDAGLRELAQSPLMLNLIIRTYGNGTVPVPAAGMGPPREGQTARQRLFDAYITSMFRRREVPLICSPERSVRWLSWLAGRLLRDSQDSFLIERMPPDWLRRGDRKHAFSMASLLLWAPLYSLVGAVLVWLGLQMVMLLVMILLDLVLRLFGSTNLGARAVVSEDFAILLSLTWMSTRLVDALSVGLYIGLLGTVISAVTRGFKRIIPLVQAQALRRRLRSGLYFGLACGLFSALVHLLVLLSLHDESGTPLLFALVGGLNYGIAGGLVGALRGMRLFDRHVAIVEQIKSSLSMGGWTGLAFGIMWIVWLYIELNGYPRLGGSGALIYLGNYSYVAAMPVWPLMGLVLGLVVGVVFRPDTNVEPLDVKTRTPNQGTHLSLRYGLISGLSFGLAVGLLIWLSVGLALREEYGVVPQLGAAIVGVMAGLIGHADAAVKHYLLRLILWLQGHMPANLVRFLDYAASLIFLRKVGGGYIFIHRLIMEHFAAMSDTDIERIVAGI